MKCIGEHAILPGQMTQSMYICWQAQALPSCPGRGC